MLRANNEYLIDGATYKVTRTISGNTFEVTLVRDKKQTMEYMLSKAQATTFNNEPNRIKSASSWFKNITGKNNGRLSQ